jgi:hypothetical protein
MIRTVQPTNLAPNTAAAATPPHPIFWLGVHEPAWLARSTVPLFVSYPRLCRRVSLPRAACDWALDSGAFTELSHFGAWRTGADKYAADSLLYSLAIGRLQWAAPQDWCCEPTVLARTGLSVAQHQRRTTDNFLALRRRLGSLVIPVLQGWAPSEYLAHVDQYRHAGVPLDAEPLVGVGSVCRRQSSNVIRPILEPLTAAGLTLHGFGIKVRGLRLCADLLASADSMAWSYHARRRPALAGCAHPHCQNCLRYALWWRSKMVA